MKKQALDLIAVRNFIVSVIESNTIDKNSSHKISSLLPQIDNKILKYILSEDFSKSLE